MHKMRFKVTQTYSIGVSPSIMCFRPLLEHSGLFFFGTEATPTGTSFSLQLAMLEETAKVTSSTTSRLKHVPSYI
jgi:hypothetical protein